VPERCLYRHLSTAKESNGMQKNALLPVDDCPGGCRLVSNVIEYLDFQYSASLA